MKPWNPAFGPSYTPEEMLRMGVFEGKYINNIKGIPPEWKKLPKVVGPNDPPNPELNHYKVKSRQPLSVWQDNGWIKSDSNGWFHWYINYYLGRRLGEEDSWQIARWGSFIARHQGQIVHGCSLKDDECRPRQRQGLLQWGWNSHHKFDAKTIEANARRMAKLTGSTIASFVGK